MEVFFLLAGFFARLVVMKRGAKSFAKNRFQRIFVPFVLGWLVMFPLLVLIWIVGVQKSGNYQFIAIPEEARDLATWKLWIGFILGGGVVSNFSLTHLWFLHQLMVIYVLFGLARGLWITCDPHGRNLTRLDLLLKRVFESRAACAILAIPTVGMLFLMPDWNVSTPMNSVIPEVGTSLLYGFCFVVGWWLHRNLGLLPSLSRSWAWSLAAGAVAISATYWFGWTDLIGLTEAPSGLRRLLYSTLYAVALWGLTLGALGLFLDCVRGESRFWRYVADSSYWVYLAHLPVVVTLQIWVAHWPVGWPIKYVVICSVTLAVLYLTYHYFVRSTFIGHQLNGRRWPYRRWPPWMPVFLGKRAPRH
jgi:peptidoglycan/LPS O-acetylase OafA/YrhL